MRRIILVKDDAAARFANVRDADFISARRAGSIRRLDLVVISLRRIRGGSVVKGSLSSGHCRQESLSATRRPAHDLIASDRRVACVGFGPAEVDHIPDTTRRN